MRLRELIVENVSTAFRGREARIDFAALGEGVVCLVGVNGSGKSHLLECAGPGTLYRTLVSYDEPFAAHVPAGLVGRSELRFELGGTEYRAVVLSDPNWSKGRGKTEAYLHGPDGPIAGPLVREYDEAIAKLFPPLDLFTASVFSAQGGAGSFFAMPKAARKDLFVSLLGLDRLSKLWQRAGDRVRALRAEAAANTTITDRYPVAALRDAVATEQANLDAGQARLVEQSATLATAEQAADAAERVNLALTEKLRVAKERQERRVEAERTLAFVRKEQDALTTLIGRREEIATAERELAAARVTLEEAQHAHAEQRATYERLKAETVERHKEVAYRGSLVSDLGGELNDCLKAYDRVKGVARLEEDHGRAVRDTEQADKLLKASTERLRQIEDDCTVAAGVAAMRRSMTAQITHLTAQVDAARGVDLTLALCQACPLTAAARAAGETIAQLQEGLAGLPEPPPNLDYDREQLRIQVGKWEHTLDLNRRAAESLSRELATLAGPRALAEKLPELDRRYEQLKAEYATARAAVDAAVEAETAAIEAGKAARLRLDAAKARVAELEPVAGLAPALAAATARHEALADQASGADAILAHIPDQGSAVLNLEFALNDAGEALVAARQARAAAARDLSVIETGMAASQERRRALARDLEAGEAAAYRLAQVTTAASDAQLLETALGRDGVQALEIDAAGPAVAGLANDLLRACYGTRFSLAIETQGITKAGTVREVFDVRILDGETGREATKGSGGEMVILDEALRLALSIYNRGHSGYELQTLWRDETAGALSPDNAQRYVQMLRAARELGGFHQIVFIAHSPEVWEAADRRVFITDGQITTD